MVPLNCTALEYEAQDLYNTVLYMYCSLMEHDRNQRMLDKTERRRGKERSEASRSRLVAMAIRAMLRVGCASCPALEFSPESRRRGMLLFAARWFSPAGAVARETKVGAPGPSPGRVPRRQALQTC